MQLLSETRVADTARLLTALVPRLHRAVRGQVGPTAGLSMPQFVTLRALHGGALPSSVIAQKFGVSRPTVTRMVDGLAKKGLVERRVDAADRRVAMVALTAQGRALLQATESAAEQHLTDLLEHMAPDRLAALRTGLTDLVELLDAAIEGPAARRPITKGGA